MEGEVAFDLGDEPAAEITNAYKKLCIAFQEKTGLELNLSYSEEMESEYWWVEGVYVLSPAGKKYQDKIEYKMWTEFG